MLLMLVMGMAFGAIMGFFITYLKVQPFIATLAGHVVRARACASSSATTRSPSTTGSIEILGQTKILIPGLGRSGHQDRATYITILVVVALVVLVAAIYIAHYTRFGRTVYAIGGATSNRPG